MASMPEETKREELSPGDDVTWFKSKAGGQYTLIKAQAWYKTGNRWAIRFKNRMGEPCVRYINRDMLERGHRKEAISLYLP